VDGGLPVDRGPLGGWVDQGGILDAKAHEPAIRSTG
jgi:hypothetical protein